MELNSYLIGSGDYQDQLTLTELCNLIYGQAQVIRKFFSGLNLPGKVLLKYH